MMAAVTVEEIVVQVGVAEEKLKEKCSDEHLVAISSLGLDWRVVAPHLGLSDSEIDDIDQEGKREQERRRKVLEKWRQKNAFKATYKMLVEVLLKIGRADQAEVVCRLLKNDNSTEPSVPKRSKLLPGEPSSELTRSDQGTQTELHTADKTTQTENKEKEVDRKKLTLHPGELALQPLSLDTATVHKKTSTIRGCDIETGEQRDDFIELEADIVKLTWKQGKFTPQPLHKGTVAVRGSKAYFIGADSSTIQEYNFEAGEWECEIECEYEGPALVFIGDLLTAVGGHERHTGNSRFPRVPLDTNTYCQNEQEVTNKVMTIDLQKPDKGWLEKYPPMLTKKILPQAVCTGEYLIAIGKKAGYKEVHVAVEVMNTSPPYQWQRAKGPTIQLSMAGMFWDSYRSAVVCKDSIYLATDNSVAYAHLKDIVDSCTTVSNPVRKKVVWQEIPYPGDLVLMQQTYSLSDCFVVTTLVTLEDHLLCLSHEHKSGYVDGIAQKSRCRLDVYDIHGDWTPLATSEEQQYFCGAIATALPALGKRLILAIVGGTECVLFRIFPYRNVYLVNFEL